MLHTIQVSAYHSSLTKKSLDYLGSFALLAFFSPAILLITIIIKLENHGPVLFKQERIGKNGKGFTLIKFRTMIVGAEKLREKYKYLNIADGPVFKIPNDPRYTKFGKILAKTGMDEIPQLINVLKGEMSLVGPRPLPLIEAKELTRSQKIRECILPGITSDWVINGAHNLKFKYWMELDKVYVQNATLTTDIRIAFKTAKMIFSLYLRKFRSAFENPTSP